MVQLAQSPASPRIVTARMLGLTTLEEIDLRLGLRARQMGCIRTPLGRLFWLIVVISAAIPLVGCTGGPELTRHEFMRPAMGGRAYIVLYSETFEEAVEASRAAFDRIEKLNDVMSDY
ncbi:MAG: hypothetical protein IIB55_04605, partial [Planctomycetes bacterium]|nr:hypothetical protein [Planctomycetota bacterium]